MSKIIYIVKDEWHNDGAYEASEGGDDVIAVCESFDAAQTIIDQCIAVAGRFLQNFNLESKTTVSDDYCCIFSYSSFYHYEHQLYIVKTEMNKILANDGSYLGG